jgi:predicted outer membrane repeat protein
MFVGNCDINDNSAFRGGGIYTAGSFGMTVSGCSLIGNRATGSAAAWGGGLWNAAALTVSNSTFFANSTSGAAGGIDNWASLAISNSTFFGNSADSGAALCNLAGATLTSVTVTSNVSTGQGGAVFNSGTLRLDNSIVAANFLGMTGGPASDVMGVLDGSSSFNLIGTGGSGGLSGGVNGNQVGVGDPKLGPLTNDGGVLVCPLLPRSPAIGTGDPSLLGTTDQRGVVRTGSVSIGAFQFQG